MASGVIDQMPAAATAAESIGYWPIDKPFPALLTDTQLRQVFGLSRSHFCALKKLGRFELFVARPQITDTVRYSGEKVRTYCRGLGASFAQTFGGKRQARAQQPVAMRKVI